MANGENDERGGCRSIRPLLEPLRAYWPDAARSKIRYCGYVCAPDEAQQSPSEALARHVARLNAPAASLRPVVDRR